MPTQTKQRQDKTRYPPQKSIMQNTDVKQTKNQPYLFQRHSIRKFSSLQKKKSVELRWPKSYNIEQGKCVHADHTINMPSTSVQRAEYKNIARIRSIEKGTYTNQLSIFITIKSEFLQMFTQLPFFSQQFYILLLSLFAQVSKMPEN